MSKAYIWFITGTSRGIGLEIVRQLTASSSNTVIATCRSPESASELHDLQDSAHGKLHILRLDVNDEASIKEAADGVKEILGDRGIDYLINNAAINVGEDTAFSFAPEDLTRTIQSNVIGPALVSRYLLPYISKGERKVILSMTSGLASISLDIGDKCASYSISKTALNMVNYKQARERPDIVSIVLDPGWVKTDMGGEGAVLEPEESVSGILKVLTSLTPEQSGKFYRYNGIEVPW